MNKLILILTMLFSVVMSANNFTGTWKSTSSTYNKVILFNDGNYNFINFSFNEQKELEEEVINVSESYIKTKVYNPSNAAPATWAAATSSTASSLSSPRYAPAVLLR